MKTFIYIHPTSTIATLNTNGIEQNISLHYLGAYELPEENKFVQLMLKQGKLKEVSKANENAVANKMIKEKNTLNEEQEIKDLVIEDNTSQEKSDEKKKLQKEK